MYKKGDVIVYGKSGVCIVDDICEVEFGIEGLCYKLGPYDDQQNAIYVSVDNDKIMVRDVISAEKARDIIDQMGECPAIFPKNDKERAELVKETLNSEDMSKWMQLLKGLYIEREKRLRMRKSLKYKDEKVFSFNKRTFSINSIFKVFKKSIFYFCTFRIHISAVGNIAL